MALESRAASRLARVCIASTVGLAACAAVTGLGDFKIIDDAADAAPDVALEGAPASDAGAFDGGLSDASVAVPVVLYAAASDHVIRAVAVSEGRLFWLDLSAKELVQAELDAGTPTTIAVGISANQFAVQGAQIWYSGTELRRKTIGGADVSLGTGTINGCVSIHPNGATIYSTDYKAGRIIAIPAEGGTASPLFAETEPIVRPWGIATGGAQFYYTSADTSIVSRLPGDPSMVIVEGGARLNCIALDGNEVLYWTDYDRGTISRANTDGGAVATLATGQTNPTQVALDGEFLYWNSGNKVMRLSRPVK